MRVAEMTFVGEFLIPNEGISAEVVVFSITITNAGGSTYEVYNEDTLFTAFTNYGSNTVQAMTDYANSNSI